MYFITSLVHNFHASATSRSVNGQYRKAISSALVSVASTYPEYNGIGFDEHFMDNEAASIMEPYLTNGTVPTVEALTEAWAKQFPFKEASAKKAIENITPMVTDFLYVLGRETSFIPTTEPKRTVPVHNYSMAVPEPTPA